MIRRLLLILVAAVLVLSAELAFAWESDFHYGLTKWLAIQAGFAGNDPEIIAQGTLNRDHGINDARFLVLHYACLGRDLQASENVRDDHFPSFAKLPTQPKDRDVVAGSDAAAREAKMEIEYTGPGDRDYGLKKFGEALHPLQDSWSHAGIPGAPWFCSSELSWGHPDTRGGWRRHDADFTSYKDPNTAINAANATYEMMQAYLAKRKWPASGKSWVLIKADVGKFVELATKSAKQEWFAEHGFTKFDFLTETNLDEGETQFSYSARLARVPTCDLPDTLKELSERKAPKDVRKFFQEFISAWIMDKESKNVMNRFVNAEAVGKSMAQESREALAISPDMVDKRFWIWRLRDHGLANKLGHGVGALQSKTLLDDLSKTMGKPNALTSFKSVSSALVPLSKGAPPYLVVEIPRWVPGTTVSGEDGTRYAAVLRFKNAPHDLVMAIASRKGSEWRIVDLIWTIDH